MPEETKYKQGKGIFSLYEQDDSGQLSIELQGIRYTLPTPPFKTEMLFSTKPKLKQKWERHDLPTFAAKDVIWAVDTPDDPQSRVTWEQAVRQEDVWRTGYDSWELNTKGEPKRVSSIKPNPDFCIEAVDAYRSRELDRCNPYTEGVWVTIKGLAVYLTPYYYKYIQWTKNDNGYPDFYWEECKVFYHWQYVKESNLDMGRIEGAQRGRGKSARMSSVGYDEAIWHEKAHVTGQGRNDKDAEDFFTKKIVVSYKEYPDFLRPINSNSTNPTVNLRFSPAAKSGKHGDAFIQDQKNALNSIFDYNKAGEKACDGKTLKFYWAEEIGKTKPHVASVDTRWNVVRECLWRNSRKVGSAWMCTTVEEQSEGGEPFRRLWRASDPSKRDANGQTESGLLKYFLSALVNTYFDDWGFSDIEKAKTWLYNRRESLKEKPDEWRQFVRKFPITEEEMFMFGSGSGRFDELILSERQMILSNPDRSGLTQELRFVREADGKVGYRVYKGAPWEVSWLPNIDVKSNNVVQGKSTYTMEGVRVDSLLPQNEFIEAGVDPVSHIQEFLEDEKRGSDNACVIRMKYHPAVDEAHHHIPVAIYRHRDNNPDDDYDQMLLGLEFYGCSATCESNKQDFIKYAFRTNRAGFVKPKKGTEGGQKPVPGEASSGSEGGLINYYTGRIKNHVILYGHKYNHLQLIDELFIFDPNDTKKYDATVGFGLSLVPEPVIKAEKASIDIKDFFG